MTFSNPIVGGITLIRPAIQSPDYVAGSAGWSINKDGTAEFNDVTIRGDGNGDALVVGPDNGPQVQIGSTASAGYIEFPTNRPVEHDVSTILAGVLNSGLPNEAASLQIFGPSVDGATDRCSLFLSSQNNDGSSQANVVLTTGGGQLSMDESLLGIGGPRFLHGPSDSASTAHALVLGAGYTGNAFRVTKGGSSKFIVSSDGDVTASVVNANAISAGNIQTGLEPVTTTAGVWVEVVVNFPQPFTTTPVVTVTGNSNAPATGGTTTLQTAVTNVTTTSFNLKVFRSTAITMNIGWIAIS